MYKCTICFVLAFLCCPSWGFQTFEDNIQFCINKETTHLSEEQNTDCDILATPLTTNEKLMFQNTMCKDYSIDTFYYFKLRYGNLVGRGEDRDICNIIDNLLLAWIPYEQFKKYYGKKLNLTEVRIPKTLKTVYLRQGQFDVYYWFKFLICYTCLAIISAVANSLFSQPSKLYVNTRLMYIAKAIDENDKTELCYFPHIDLIYNNTEQPFACVLMIYEDNFFGLKNSINVLVEIENLRNNGKSDL